MKGYLALGAVCAVLAAGPSRAEVVYGESPRDTVFQLKLGTYRPGVQHESGLTFDPYEKTFGNHGMLLFELSWTRLLWQRVGAAGVGLHAGYAEKYARATTSGGTTTSEKTGLHVIPLALLGHYQFDYGALHLGIPLVPYVRFGPMYEPWWSTKGSKVEYVDGKRAAGGKWGYEGQVGLELLLDFFEPQFARDFDSDMGVNHSYFFVEYDSTQPTLGGSGLDLSAQHWMFGLTLEL